MSRLDIIICKLILVIAGMLIVAAELCLLVHGLLTGIDGNTVSARALFLVAGLLLVTLALRVRRR